MAAGIATQVGFRGPDSCGLAIYDEKPGQIGIRNNACSLIGWPSSISTIAPINHSRMTGLYSSSMVKS